MAPRGSSSQELAWCVLDGHLLAQEHLPSTQCLPGPTPKPGAACTRAGTSFCARVHNGTHGKGPFPLAAVTEVSVTPHRWLWSSLILRSEIEIDQLMYFVSAASFFPVCSFFVPHWSNDPTRGDLILSGTVLGAAPGLGCLWNDFVHAFQVFNFCCEIHPSGIFHWLQELGSSLGAAPGLWPVLESLWLLAFPDVLKYSRGIGSQSTAAAVRGSMREAIFWR